MCRAQFTDDGCVVWDGGVSQGQASKYPLTLSPEAFVPGSQMSKMPQQHKDFVPQFSSN